MDTFEQLQTRLLAAFRADTTATLRAVYQFSFDDGEPFHLTINRGTIDIQRGAHSAATVTMLLDNHATALGILTHELDGIAAFMDGRLRSDGHLIMSLMLFAQFFGRPR